MSSQFDEEGKDHRAAFTRNLTSRTFCYYRK